jgi:site-specific recombinase XerD
MLKLQGLRHSAITNAAETGVSSRDIADAMGNAYVATTDRYSQRTFLRLQKTALAPSPRESTYPDLDAGAVGEGHQA